MPAILHVVEGPDSGRLFTLHGDQATIGRNAENTIVLNDGAVSGVHTKICRNEDGQFTIHDAESTNGTFLNGREQRASDLKNGDRFSIGATTFSFELREDPKRIRTVLDDLGAVEAQGPSTPGIFTLPEWDPTRLTREELERSHRRGNILNAFDRALTGLSGANEVLGAALEAALTVTGAPRGVVLLVDAKTGEMLPSVVRSEDGVGEVCFSKGLAFEVAAGDKAWTGEDTPGRQALCAPVRMTTRTTTGVMYLEGAPGASFGPGDVDVIEAITRRAGVYLSANRWRVDFELLFSSTIDAIMNTIQAKDVYTRGHSERVRHYSKLLAKELGLSREEIDRVTLGAALHDIGKVGMPDSVLKNNTQPKLTPEQMDEVRKHPARGARILGDISFLKDVIPAAELHHEDWGGGGYPHGLSGEEIPLIARIVAVADTYDAITTDRPYQKGKSYEEGMDILRKLKGKRLEPDLVDHFVRGWTRYRKGPVRTTVTGRLDAGTIEAAKAAKPADAPRDEPELDDTLSQIIEIG